MKILSREEVARLVHSADNLKQRALLTVAYGAGLRVSEFVHLHSRHIDADCMSIRIEQARLGTCFSSTST